MVEFPHSAEQDRVQAESFCRHIFNGCTVKASVSGVSSAKEDFVVVSSMAIIPIIKYLPFLIIVVCNEVLNEIFNIVLRVLRFGNIFFKIDSYSVF